MLSSCILGDKRGFQDPASRETTTIFSRMRVDGLSF